MQAGRRWRKGAALPLRQRMVRAISRGRSPAQALAHLLAPSMTSDDHQDPPDFIDLWRAQQIHAILVRYGRFQLPEVERTPSFRELAAARDREIAAVEVEALRRKSIAAEAADAVARI